MRAQRVEFGFCNVALAHVCDADHAANLGLPLNLSREIISAGGGSGTIGMWLAVGVFWSAGLAVCSRTGWLRFAHVGPAPPSGADIVAYARRYLGAVYVWGGLSPYGLDCSGLVHVVWRHFGIVVPRDASEQASACTPVDSEKPGDLLKKYPQDPMGKHVK